MIRSTSSLNCYTDKIKLKNNCYFIGADKGTCGRLEQFLSKPLLYLACRHHIYELILRSVIETVWPGINSPNITVFVRFRNGWDNIDKTKYKTGIQDPIIENGIRENKNGIIEFILARLEVFKLREFVSDHLLAISVVKR